LASLRGGIFLWGAQMPQRDDLEFNKFDDHHGGKFPAVRMVTDAHSHINSGRSFMVGDIFLAIPNDGVAEGLFQLTNEMHGFLIASSQGDFEVRIFEDPTFSNAGTPMTILNKKRDSNKVSGTTVTHTPTLTDDGLALPPAFIVGGTGGNASGGQGDSFSSEIIFAAGKTYLFRLVNKSGQAATMMGRLEWYEPDAAAP